MKLEAVVRQAADGRQIVHFDGRAYELNPSSGEVYCPAGYGQALHHSRDCGHIMGTDVRAYPDPDRDLWRRLLEVAPDNTHPARAEFALAHGLLNGAGKPVVSDCGSCTLPDAVIGGVRSPAVSLTKAQREYDRAAIAPAVALAEEEVIQVVQDFPLDTWPMLPLERYALGTEDTKKSFCYRMEFGTSALASMKGGSAMKHLIFRRKSDQSWYFDQKLFRDEHGAWTETRAEFVEAFRRAGRGDLQAIDELELLRSGPSLVAKTISCYFPDQIIPVNSRDHVRLFLYHLTGEDASSLDPFAAHERLKTVTAELFPGWHAYEIAKFLYAWTPPNTSPTILKVAPGHGGSEWPECLAGGYICLGWEEIGDLTAFTSEADYKAAFNKAFLPYYNGSQSKVTAKANEVWKFFQLQPGDLVVANNGTRGILGVGTVTEAGYAWRPDRERYQHTVAVTWDTSYAQELAEPQKSWATVTVAGVPGTLWRKLKAGGATSTEVDDQAQPVEPVEPLFQRLASQLERKGQAILYGPPGTGKTYTSLRFALWWLGKDTSLEYGTAPFRQALDALGAQLTQVTFHPAYGYEDFIEGFRPVQGDGDGLRLELIDGIFKRVCEEASKNPDMPYLLLIDEINRGDIPKILGELITLLERDKRGLHLTLPQSGQKFTVPANVHILGTMNTADRSVRLLDTALRRRFAFSELLPDPTLLDGNLVGKLDLGQLLRELNRRVVAELGRERQIGHSFLLPGGKVVDSEADLASVVRDEILPLLQEYAYDDYALLEKFLGRTVIDAKTHSVTDLPDEQLVEELYLELTGSE